MSDGEDSAEKEHEPTQKRLEDARERGDFARSADLNTAAGYAGLLLAAVAVGGDSLTKIGEVSATLLGQADSLAPLMLSGETGPLAGLLGTVAWAVAPWFLAPAAAALLAILAQRSLVFTGDKLEPKLSRISPFAAAGQKFGREGLFEFAKSLAKLVLVSVILGTFLLRHMSEILGSMNLAPAMATSELLRIVVSFLFLILMISLSFGALDYLWQQRQLLHRNRMSRQDMIDEQRQSDGDPHMKQQRRQRGYEIAMNQMLAEVPKADVIIVNPTHYAVALKWRKGDRGAPVCVAKGVDDVASRIRAAAALAGVPIHRDPHTARALYATVEIGQEIRPDHYRAVAAAIRFAESIRRKMRARSRGAP